MRTKLVDRVLPIYPRKLEAFNSISHIVGGALAVIYMIMCIIVSVIHNNAVGVLCSIIYGIGNINLYTMSAIYHGMHFGIPKKVFQILDHCSIYGMIACTYMPVIFCKIMPLDPRAGWILFILELAIASIATTLTAIDLKQYKVFSMVCNIVLGWAIILFPKLIVAAVSITGVLLLLVGGLFYTIGAILYAIGKKKPIFHGVFHIFVILGTFIQFLAIILYVL
ncbi:MAG: hemolysin III family protein [Erysipelotrichaceae bacterium]|nr:hemolysin III family protein [Erysipelotrichaceae bacterium]